MAVAKRIITLLGAVALASTLAACGDGAQEVDADENDQSQSDASDSNESAETSETDSAPEEFFDGEQVTIAKVNEYNAEDACMKAIGHPEDSVFEAFGIEAKDGVESTYSSWDATVEIETWNIAPTLGCHGFINKDATDGSERGVHIWITETGNDWGENPKVAPVQTRNDSIQASMSFDLPEDISKPDDESASSFLENDVLPKFKP